MSPKPMLTEDYLIRQINLAIAALARILGLKTAGQYQAALFEIDQLLEELIGLRSYMIKNLADEGILAILATSDGLDTDRLLVVADLIRHEGDLYAQKGYREDGLANYQRALKFYLEVHVNGGLRMLQPPDEQINALVEALSPAHLPVETAYNLSIYYETSGQFAQAEKMLDYVKAATSSSEDLLDEYNAFYTRLLEKRDADLEKGSLSRQYVERKLNDLHV
jgi:tetratricopeptide (TPR) repeat protein